jgi:hypothetical protein
MPNAKKSAKESAKETVKKPRVQHAPWGRPRIHDVPPIPILVRLTPPFMAVVDQYAAVMHESRPAAIRRMIAIASRHLNEALRLTSSPP